MKKLILLSILACISLTASAQYSDTTLTRANWQNYRIGADTYRFQLPADTVDSAENDTVTISFPQIFSSLFLAKFTVSSDTLVDTIPADPLSAVMLIETAPTPNGPWTTEKSKTIDSSITPITDTFYLRDLYMRVRYIATDGEGRVRAWITLKIISSII